MFKIMASIHGHYLELERDLSFREACHMAEVYKTKNSEGYLSVINQETDDCVYQV